mgnify:CR=1 FL=1
MNVMEELKAFALCAPPSAGLSAQARQLFYAAMEQRLRRPNETDAQYLGRVLTLAHCSDFLEAAKNADLPLTFDAAKRDEIAPVIAAQYAGNRQTLHQGRIENRATVAKSLGAYLTLCLVQAYDAELEVLPNPYARPGMPAIGGQLYVRVLLPDGRRADAYAAAEALAARDWGAAQAFFLTGGSTQGILAMLGAAVGRGGSVLIDREVHRSVCHGCALLDITPYFFSAPLLEPFGITGALRVEDAERQLLAHPDIRAVLLTSPTYYGLRRDLPAFADLCRAHGKLLLVDAAHGAHFPAVGLPSPVEEGADMAVLSMHKTMPCLGQAAVLLSGPGTDRASLRENTALFGTSSPSYPIMASIDLARAYNEGPGREKYQKAAAVCREMREYICAHTVFTALTERDFPSLDPCRLTVCTAGTDITGHALADALWSEHGVACEMADERSVVFILTESDTAGAIHRLRRGLRVLSRRRRETALPVETRPFPPAERVMSVRDARFAPSAEVSLSDAEGRVCARPVTPYPPGVPLLWPGEKITKAHVELIRERWYNDIDRITVVMPEK